MYDFLKSFSDTQQLSTSVIIIRLLVCFLLSSFVATFYQKIYRNQLPIKELTPLILLSLCIASVLMSIGNSIPHSFGLFAALTLIRFRTPIKSSKDLVTLFFFIVIGITCGLGHFKVSLLSITFITAAIYFVGIINQSSSSNLILQVLHRNGPLNKAQQEIIDTLNSLCNATKMLEVRSLNKEDTEFVFEIKVKNINSTADIIDKVKSIGGIQQVYVQNSFNEAEVF